MHRSPAPFRRTTLASVTFSMTCLVVCLGCGDGKIATFPVTGTVTVDGQPAEGALLIFCPVGGSEEFSKVRPAGKTKSGGKYELSTFDALDGAPAGEYQVMVRWAPENQQSTEEGRDDRARRPQDQIGRAHV